MFMATGICSAPARRWKSSRFEESRPDSSNSHPALARMMRFAAGMFLLVLATIEASKHLLDEKSPRILDFARNHRKAVNPRLRFRCELGGGDDACGNQSQSGASCFFSRGS